MGNNISYETTPTELSLGARGRIRGTQYDQKSRRYAGVPYALPPTAEHRWRKPRPLPKSYVYKSDDGSPYDATDFKPVCPQKLFSKVAKAEGEQVQYSEDCLFVNIWTPVPKDGEQEQKWPVVLWLHGGWFAMGDPSQEPGMDPTELISTGGLNTVFVAIGYRLNIFGFLAGSAVLEDNNGEAAGNFGLWDQRVAMEWVQENIHHFGGDPENVTLGGRSAGAYATQAQVLHEFRRNEGKVGDELFRRFYMISNAIPAQPKTVAESQAQFDEVCEHFKVPPNLSGKEKLSLLRQISSQDLVAALEHLQHHTFRPITDDLFLHSGMIDYLTSGDFAAEFQKRHMRLLIGEVLNEETLYAEYHSPVAPTRDALCRQLENYYAPATVERVMPHYELPEDDSIQDWKSLYGNIVADGQVRAPSRYLARQLFEHGVPIEKIWRYQIAYRLSFITDKVAPQSFGVAHAMDRPFWNFSITHGPTPEERTLMYNWIQPLVAFVHDDNSYDFGTKVIDEMKVATADGKIAVLKDDRWTTLTNPGQAFARG